MIQAWRFEACYMSSRKVVRIQMFLHFSWRTKQFIYIMTPDFQISLQNQGLQVPLMDTTARERESVGRKNDPPQQGGSWGTRGRNGKRKGSREARCNWWRWNRYWSLPKNVGASTKPLGQPLGRFEKWRTAVSTGFGTRPHTVRRNGRTVSGAPRFSLKQLTFFWNTDLMANITGGTTKLEGLGPDLNNYSGAGLTCERRGRC